MLCSANWLSRETRMNRDCLKLARLKEMEPINPLRLPLPGRRFYFGVNRFDHILVFFHDHFEGRGESSAMISGYKFIEEEIYEAEKLETEK